MIIFIINEYRKSGDYVGIVCNFVIKKTNNGNNQLLRQFIDDGLATDAIAQLNLDPKDEHRIDWILCKGFDVVSGEFAPKGISDHPYYAVQLRYA